LMETYQYSNEFNNRALARNKFFQTYNNMWGTLIKYTTQNKNQYYTRNTICLTWKIAQCKDKNHGSSIPKNNFTIINKGTKEFSISV